MIARFLDLASKYLPRVTQFLGFDVHDTTYQTVLRNTDCDKTANNSNDRRQATNFSGNEFQ